MYRLLAEMRVVEAAAFVAAAFLRLPDAAIDRLRVGCVVARTVSEGC